MWAGMPQWAEEVCKNAYIEDRGIGTLSWVSESSVGKLCLRPKLSAVSSFCFLAIWGSASTWRGLTWLSRAAWESSNGWYEPNGVGREFASLLLHSAARMWKAIETEWWVQSTNIKQRWSPSRVWAKMATHHPSEKFSRQYSLPEECTWFCTWSPTPLLISEMGAAFVHLQFPPPPPRMLLRVARLKAKLKRISALLSLRLGF